MILRSVFALCAVLALGTQAREAIAAPTCVTPAFSGGTSNTTSPIYGVVANGTNILTVYKDSGFFEINLGTSVVANGSWYPANNAGRLTSVTGSGNTLKFNNGQGTITTNVTFNLGGSLSGNINRIYAPNRGTLNFLSGTSTISVQAAGNCNVTSLSSGKGYSCAVMSGGVQCWGTNVEGQLGNGTNIDSSVPVQVSGLTTGVTAVSAGQSHACALVNGGVWCWGLNMSGQLGNGTISRSNVPVQVSGLGSGFMAIAAGGEHTCAVKSSNYQIYCWGYNGFGQLGNGNFTSSTLPVAIPTSVAMSNGMIGAGYNHTCVGYGNAAYCWGNNQYGQVGNGQSGNRITTPTLVQGLTSSVAQIHVNSNSDHSCAADYYAIKCWGQNSSGQLGDGTTTNRNKAVVSNALGGTTSTGRTFTCGNYYTSTSFTQAFPACWGKNDVGQLGTGNYTNSTTRQNVPGFPVAVTRFAAGYDHACAISGGAVWCWGDNTQGELGLGYTSSGGVNSITQSVVGL